MNDFICEMESNLDPKNKQQLAIKQVTFTELTQQPYAG